MEKKLENMALNEDALEEVTGGVIHAESALGVAHNVATAQQGFVTVQNVIDVNPVAGLAVGAQACVIQPTAEQVVAQENFNFL